MNYQWQIVALNPSGEGVTIYQTHLERLAYQEWKASQQTMPYSTFTDFRLMRREVGEWEDVSDAS